MFTLYNTFDEISIQLANHFLSCSNNISKPQAFNLSYITLASCLSNSTNSSIISSKFKGILSFNKPDSNQKRVKRFWNNHSFNPYQVWKDLITDVINNYKVKHNDNKVYICFDYSYNKDDFTSIVFTLIIGKQAIPIYFECFKGINNKKAYSIDTIKKAILFVHNLFKNQKIIFLADRWFNDSAIFEYIESLNHFYCVRTKTNINVSINNNPFISLSEIKPWKNNSKLFSNVLFTETQKFNVNIAIGPYKNTDNTWYIVTNLNPQYALKCYGKRFEGIEFFFKSQKSNGFNLEKTTVSNLNAFTNMFFSTCVSILWLTILGADYVKNKPHSKINFYDVRRTNNKIIRVKSLFRLGMEIINNAYNSYVKHTLKYNFILYDL